MSKLLPTTGDAWFFTGVTGCGLALAPGTTHPVFFLLGWELWNLSMVVISVFSRHYEEQRRERGPDN